MESASISHEEHHGNKNDSGYIFADDADDALNIQIDNNTEKNFFITGRRIVDIGVFWKQIKNMKHASFFNCSIDQCEIINEKLVGFKTIITVKCAVLRILWTLIRVRANWMLIQLQC